MTRNAQVWQQAGRPAQENGSGQDFSKGHQGYDFDVIPMDGFKRQSLGGVYICNCKLTKGMNSGSPTISGRGGQEHIMQQYKEWEYFSFGVELWADFPINAHKIEKFISHKLRGLFIKRKGTSTTLASITKNF